MKKALISFKCLLITILIFVSTTSTSQATLTIINNSSRFMTIKIMKGSNGKGRLYKMATIPSWASNTIYFNLTGYYFTKSKAEISNKSPLYKKGNPFKVVNDSHGYSILTLTYSISESAVELSSGLSISKNEFDEN